MPAMPDMPAIPVSIGAPAAVAAAESLASLSTLSPLFAHAAVRVTARMAATAFRVLREVTNMMVLLDELMTSEGTR